MELGQINFFNIELIVCRFAYDWKRLDPGLPSCLCGHHSFKDGTDGVKKMELIIWLVIGWIVLDLGFHAVMTVRQNN